MGLPFRLWVWGILDEPLHSLMRRSIQRGLVWTRLISYLSLDKDVEGMAMKQKAAACFMLTIFLVSFFKVS